MLQVSRKLSRLYSEMIFVHGYVHCDPHPGNVLVNKTDSGTQIVLLDHGLYQVGCTGLVLIICCRNVDRVLVKCSSGQLRTGVCVCAHMHVCMFTCM